MKTNVGAAKIHSLLETIAKYALCMAALAVLGMPASANAAESCTAFGKGIISGFGTIPSGDIGEMQVTLVSNRSDGQYGSYGEMPSLDGDLSGASTNDGPLVYSPAIKSLDYPAALQGTLAQFFSNRRYANPDNVGVDDYTEPFTWQPVDNLGITIYLQTNKVQGVTAGEVVLTLNSWGGTNVVFSDQQCQDGMITAFNGNTEIVVSLFNQQVISPPQ